MMNRPVSNRLQLLRYALAGPLVVAAALAYSAAHAQPTPNPAILAAESFAIAKADEAQPALADLTTAAQEPRASIAATKATKTELPVAVAGEKARRVASAEINVQRTAPGAHDQAAGIVNVSTPQYGPKPGLKPFKGTARSYYVDGQAVDQVTAMALNGNDIASIQGLKGEMAKQFWGYEGDSRIVIAITTKAKMDSPEVVEFNSKVQQIAPLKGLIADRNGRPRSNSLAQTAPPAGREVPISYVAAPALAYITKNYPDSRITGVTELKNAKTGQLNYRVEVAKGRRPQYVVFDAQGQPVSE